MFNVPFLSRIGCQLNHNEYHTYIQLRFYLDCVTALCHLYIFCRKLLAKLDYLLENNFEIKDQLFFFLTEVFKELKVYNFVESGIYKMENYKKPNSVEGDLV